MPCLVQQMKESRSLQYRTNRVDERILISTDMLNSEAKQETANP